jgi:isocitrate lyase
VLTLRGSIPIEHTLARRGALKLGSCCSRTSLSARSVPVAATRPCRWSAPGLKAIYLAGWQDRSRFERHGSMYPTSRCYPPIRPELGPEINKTLQRADQIEHLEGGAKRDWFAHRRRCEAGFGGPLNCFEIMKAYIEAGARAFTSRTSSRARRSAAILGGKVLIPTQAAIRS